MKSIQHLTIVSLALLCNLFLSCNDKDTPGDNFDTTGTYSQDDQMGRPAINTVFVSSADKNSFNTTVPSAMGAAFQTKFQNRLLALNPGYTTNVLMLNAAQFTTVLATDVLNVSMNGATAFGTLTGRGLADDVITTELTLIFGGPSGTSNPGLRDDNVSANDKAFLSTFPYLATPH